MEPHIWLTILFDELAAQRRKARFLRSYTNGNPPLPEMGPQLSSQWRNFQYKSVLNTGGLVVDALAERIVVNGVLVGGKTTEATQRIYRDNRLATTFKDAIRDALETSVGYLAISRDRDGLAVITREKPENMVAIPDPVRPWRCQAALKVWHDRVQKTDFAYLWVGGVRYTYVRPRTANRGEDVELASGWLFTGDVQPIPGGRVPVVRLPNPDGKGEFEAHTGLLDRINWGILQRMILIAMQAARQRAIVTDKDVEGLKDVDSDGNDIDYSKIFRPGPGALWELPPGVTLWESSQTDIRPLLDSSKDDIRQLAAVTRTPVTMLMPDSANQSAEGASAVREGLVFKAEDRISRFEPALAVAIVYALEVENVSVNETVKVSFKPSALVTLAERYDAAVKAKSVGESVESIQQNILGYSPEQIAVDRAGRMQAMFELAVGAPTGGGINVPAE